MFLIYFLVIAAVLRIGSLIISMRNEARLRAGGGVEHHAGTTRLLAIAHVAFYVLAFVEGISRHPALDWVSLAGLVIYAGAMLALVWVICQLGQLWTVKLMIAKDHELVTGSLFARLRHPNYFLNIIPELLGFALVMHAWSTLVIGLPLYAIILRRRISQEERIMRAHFAGY
ncbi:Uncharacterized protein YpbQ, isoprenylcysteine carboxyl methyltransferase (ICMT) family [Pseudooceanicola antarcticus]|uniref:Uncharacterized protein YpbQ, isoprenylcysteine carboxyl methyltransferase (ICMT) family n=1 Tax=Pseudooceanicola antarcticus TaxID=1247613 RepID=A0A285J5W6_9RHOB|nr:isoprenylcysteine carboxylmethyltransferase family protein [Pseudooceanicola antarcticus]PJE26837.1 hypothetical protein CVM39_15995 [Pseudooceanicola antarcticus]SNY55453.1 Uncharacterized protein YpbQ, isoprenylcysteine carboxyl methyltransferase (ICMT) family [Pseudooceanicola antarcticus]